MGEEIVNRPKRTWVGRGYVMLLVSVVILFSWVFTIASPKMSSNESVFFILLFGSITALFAVMVYCYYGTKYVIRDGVLHSWSPFAVINLPLKDVVKLERQRVPVHMRVGASLYSGRFYIPGVGWTRAIITNLTDGILIYAKDGRKYLITPSDPDNFAKLLKR